jgi:thiaminase (transcriptional activator TenA)
LSPDRYRAFLAQDAFFLRAFAQAYGLALARSPDTETITAFYELIGGVLQELKLHHGVAGTQGIDLERVVPSPACRAYTDFLLRTAWHTSLGETVAAMTPCMRLYAYLGKELASNCGPRNPYREWIETYASAPFELLAHRLEELLDRVGTDTPEVRDAYRFAMRCEIDFFSDAFSGR